MTEPTLLMAVLSALGSIFFALIALAGIIWFLAESHRTKRYPTKNEWAYRHNDCNMKFITEGGGK